MKKSNFLCLISVLIGTNTACFAENLFDVNRTNLTGDWDGKRTALADKGIKFDASSNLDIAYLADGGYAPRQDPTYVSQFSLGSTLDLEKLINVDGVSVRVLIMARQGQSVSVEQISDPQAPQLANVQANYGRGNSGTRLAELSIEKNFSNAVTSIRVGRFAMGTYFNVMSCDFQNNSFCGAQMGKWQGNKWINAPVSQWAVMSKYSFNPEAFIQFGVFEYNPKNLEENEGWNLDTKDADGFNIPVELVWQPKNAVNDLPGIYRIGAFYNTSDEADNQKDIVTGESEDNTYGVWGGVEQQLSSRNLPNQGLYGFMNFSFHNKTTNKIGNMQQMGLKYVGLLNHHPNDIVGFAMNRVDVSDRYSQIHQVINKEAEYNIELNYSYFPMKWLMLRPNIQYVINPGATNYVDNALVLGLSSKIIF
ncbi:carbohydrate porin [Acinetobacter johnsonii]|uniref:carbohydrate porin n=1 Tax=Acinetobacter johnsonii TaxID=40214 RepID=UPI002577BB8E|nr:carbohydrate porin [Acinetobacter johnsonii]MDM1251402.1 carbohydrate porin [Acinetobacter johnsonii]